MFHLNDDNELDEVSKTASDNYEAPYHPNWEALQRRLEEEMPVKKEKRRRWLLFVFLFVSFLAGGSILWIGNRSSNNSVSVIETKNNHTPAPVGPGKEPISLLKDENNLTVRKTANDTAALKDSNKQEEYNPVYLNNKQIEKAPGVSKINAKQPAINNKYPAADLTDRQTNAKYKNRIIRVNNTKQKPGITASRFSSRNNKIRSVPSSTAAGAGKPAVNKEEKAAPVPVINQKPVVAEAGLDKDDNNAKSPNATASNASPKKIEANVDSVPPVGETETAKKITADGKKNKPISSKAFSIAFVTGTDISTVRYKYGNKPGLHAGILAGFHFNKKWSAHSGIVYTQNNYKLNGGDYHPPKNYWTQYVKLETVEGYCRMWEIPLQLRYVLNASATNKWFVSGGVSSYLMKKQQYEYAYKNNQGIATKRTWQTDSSSNYMLSILHLSTGWEKPLGKRLNLQIEPYAKMPLRGVGFGNIRLSSFGMNFSLQLKQPLKR